MRPKKKVCSNSSAVTLYQGKDTMVIKQQQITKVLKILKKKNKTKQILVFDWTWNVSKTFKSRVCQEVNSLAEIFPLKFPQWPLFDYQSARGPPNHCFSKMF